MKVKKMTDTEESIKALWNIDTVEKLRKLKVFYSHEQFADGTIRIKPFKEYILLTTKGADMDKLLSTFRAGYITLYFQEGKYETFHIMQLSGLKGEDLQCFTTYLKEFNIKEVSAIDIKPNQYVKAKYTGKTKKLQNSCKKTGKKPYQLLSYVLENRKKENYTAFIVPKNKQIKVALPFPTDERKNRTHRAFLAQFDDIKTPYQFYAWFLIPYHIIYNTQLPFLKKITSYRVKVPEAYIKSMLPKSRNLSLKNLLKLINTTDYMTCKKYDKYLLVEFTPEFIERLKQCRIINRDLTFIIEGAAFAGNNLGSTPESIKALLLFLAAEQSHKYLQITISNFLDLTGFSDKARNTVASMNRILSYLYVNGVIEYELQIKKADIKANSTLRIKLK